MNRKRELLIRAYLVLGGLILAAIILIASTVKISVIEAGQWRERGDSTKLRFVDIAPDRGNIYSADGHLLATSVPYFDIHMDLNSEPMSDAIFYTHLDSLSWYLSRHVFTEQSSDVIKRLLIRQRDAGNRYFPIKKRATYEELELIRSFPLIRLGKYKGGLVVEQESTRLKPFQNLGHRTIGMHRDEAPSVGLEAYFDEQLRGVAGKRLMQKIGNQVWVPVDDLSEIKPERGSDIITTLDMRMQDICHHALQEGLEKHDADFGLAIIMEVESGAIKAIANLDKLPKGGWWEGYNHAVGDATEPGSTFKLASMLALLEDFGLNVYDTIDINFGYARFGRNEMRDAEPHKSSRVTIKHAFELSSNVGIAKIVNQYYNKDKNAELYIEKLRQFGLDKPTGVEIPGEANPIINEAYGKGWSNVTSLPWMSHGYELKLTALQTLAFYNGVANNGVKMKPYLVDQIVTQGSAKKIKPKVLVKQMASKENIRIAQELLKGVVLYGTGRALRTSKYDFAGKSGTTKLNYWKGTNDEYQASFVGYWPLQDPIYSCIVLVNKPKRKGYYGGTVAGRIFRSIADQCMTTDLRLIKASSAQIEKEDVQKLAPTYQAGYAPDLKKVANWIPLEYNDQAESEWSIFIPEKDSIKLQNRILKPGQVPNVLGMGLRDALFILENRGMEVKVNGYGRVMKQSIEPGAKLNGQKIMLFLG